MTPKKKKKKKKNVTSAKQPGDQMSLTQRLQKKK